MTPGHELNALIAEFLGWKRLLDPDQLDTLKTKATDTKHWDFIMHTSHAWTNGEIVIPEIPKYSETLLDAWKLHESLLARELYVNLVSTPKDHRVMINRVGKVQIESELLGSGKGETFPHALCLATLQMTRYEPTPKKERPKQDFLEVLKTKFLGFDLKE